MDKPPSWKDGFNEEQRKATMTTESPTIVAHAMSADDVIVALDSHRTGLTHADAEQFREKYGPNALASSTPVPGWRRFLSHFNDVLIYILLVAALLKAIIGDWVEFGIIAAAAIAIATVGFIQEGRANKALESIKSMLALDTQVLRNGEWISMPVEELVPGDVVRLRSGDRVPADLRILSENNLQVDESALTGESISAEKDVAEVAQDAGIADRTSMAYAGTIVTAGAGEGIVVATGAATQIGHITEMVSEVEKVETPLSRQLAKLGTQISIVIGFVTVLIVAVGTLVYDFPLGDMLSAAIGFAVAAVPEGLPALVTITLALGVQQMAKRKAIARKMTAIETLGSVDTICSDKTGTLTQNEMTAKVVSINGESYKVTGTGYSPVGSIEPSTFSPAMHEALLTAALCNDAGTEKTESGWKVVGPPTEAALTVLADKAGVSREGYSRIGHVPFDSSHKFAATVDSYPDGSRVFHAVGAPDRLLERASLEIQADGSTAPLDRAAWEHRISELSSQGLRLIGLANSTRPDLTEKTPELAEIEEITFLGVVGIMDPPRPEAQEAIAAAHKAGINVKMITGDHAGTASAIARELGIGADHDELKSLTGAELEVMTDDELAAVAHEVDVYARTSPEHKIRIVRALQSHGDVVAMTGDGVNDAPSIARSDVGVAMGVKGTEATKEAADIVLSDDNFATITAAVEEGRRIYANIRKSVVFMLPTNGAQSLVILVAVLLGLALPLAPVQILWINLVTAITLSIPLSMEPAEPGIMSRPARAKGEQILQGRTFALVGAVSLLIGGVTLAVFVTVRNATGDYALAQTTALNTLAFSQLAYLFNCRILEGSSFTRRTFTGNSSVWKAIAALIGLQLLLTYAPFMNRLFHTTGLEPISWLVVLANAVAVFVVVECLKLAIRKGAISRHTPKV